MLRIYTQTYRYIYIRIHTYTYIDTRIYTCLAILIISENYTKANESIVG